MKSKNKTVPNSLLMEQFDPDSSLLNLNKLP